MICASKRIVRPDPDIYDEDKAIISALRDEGLDPGALPLGKALCLVDLVACLDTKDMTPEEIGADAPFGDFSPHRYAWKLDNLRAFREPFPVRGYQGLFDIDDRLVKE